MWPGHQCCHLCPRVRRLSISSYAACRVTAVWGKEPVYGEMMMPVAPCYMLALVSSCHCHLMSLLTYLIQQMRGRMDNSLHHFIASNVPVYSILHVMLASPTMYQCHPLLQHMCPLSCRSHCACVYRIPMSHHFLSQGWSDPSYTCVKLSSYREVTQYPW